MKRLKIDVFKRDDKWHYAISDDVNACIGKSDPDGFTIKRDAEKAATQHKRKIGMAQVKIIIQVGGDNVRQFNTNLPDTPEKLKDQMGRFWVRHIPGVESFKDFSLEKDGTPVETFDGIKDGDTLILKG